MSFQSAYKTTLITLSCSLLPPQVKSSPVVFQMTTTAMFLTTMSVMECTTVPMEEMRASVVSLSLYLY